MSDPVSHKSVQQICQLSNLVGEACPLVIEEKHPTLVQLL